MKITKTILMIAAVMLLARAVRADDTAISPFVNDQTLIVVRFDLKNLDPSASLQLCGKLLADRGDDAQHVALTKGLWQHRTDNAQKLLKGLQEAGAAHLYWLISPADMTKDLSVPEMIDRTGSGVWVVPVAGGADRAAIARLITAEPNDALKPVLRSQAIGGAVVAAKPERQVDHDGAALSPDWVKALSSEAPIVVASAPGEIFRRSFEENLPVIQTSIGALPIKQFTRGVHWISISISAAPSFSATGVIECSDAAAATSLADSINGMVKALQGRPVRILDSPFSPIMNAPDVFACKADGEQIRCAPDMNAIILPLVIKQMHDSVTVTAQNHMRELLLGSIMYMSQHREYAPSLDVMMKEQEMSPGVMEDPLQPGVKDPWIYVKPPVARLDSKMPLIYEKSETGRLVGFADGHVETRPDRASVMKLFAGTRP